MRPADTRLISLGTNCMRTEIFRCALGYILVKPGTDLPEFWEAYLGDFDTDRLTEPVRARVNDDLADQKYSVVESIDFMTSRAGPDFPHGY